MQMAAVGGNDRGWLATAFAKSLIVIFFLTLPAVNPLVRGDGVGYYAYAHSLLIDHDLHFDNEWLAANESFTHDLLDASGHLAPFNYSRTGYVKNHFTIGPAILWAPFLLAVHAVILICNHFGAGLAANGYSRPYLVAMAATTAMYGFLGLLLAFDLARRYFSEFCAFLATLGVWFASSLPVYMYFNPSWSHAQSAFAVSLFIWYWHRTRNGRTLPQFVVLALIAGLMMNVYFPNAIFLLIPGIQALSDYRRAFQDSGKRVVRWRHDLINQVAFAVTLAVALLPTFVTRWIIYGNALESDYPPLKTWAWTSPRFAQVLFSADHGLLSWTPILAPAVAGLVVLWRRDRLFGGSLLLGLLAYYYFIASYPDWDGISSFGNRFFVSLTPLFIIGLAGSLSFLGRAFARPLVYRAAATSAVAVFMLWNLGFIFQWGTLMVPSRGPVSWRSVVHNQFEVVPKRITHALATYAFHRDTMMKNIESQDIERQHPAHN